MLWDQFRAYRTEDVLVSIFVELNKRKLLLQLSVNFLRDLVKELQLVPFLHIHKYKSSVHNGQEYYFASHAPPFTVQTFHAEFWSFYVCIMYTQNIKWFTGF